MPRPADEIEPVWLTYFGVSDPKSAAARAKELGGTVLVPPSPELTDIGWQLQELRVSLFAQHLGVNGTVSEKRIRTALRDVAMTG